MFRPVKYLYVYEMLSHSSEFVCVYAKNLIQFCVTQRNVLFVSFGFCYDQFQFQSHYQRLSVLLQYCYFFSSNKFLMYDCAVCCDTCNLQVWTFTADPWIGLKTSGHRQLSVAWHKCCVNFCVEVYFLFRLCYYNCIDLYISIKFSIQVFLLLLFLLVDVLLLWWSSALA